MAPIGIHVKLIKIFIWSHFLTYILFAYDGERDVHDDLLG